jgi:hypothetical protein
MAHLHIVTLPHIFLLESHITRQLRPFSRRGGIRHMGCEGNSILPASQIQSSRGAPMSSPDSTATEPTSEPTPQPARAEPRRIPILDRLVLVMFLLVGIPMAVVLLLDLLGTLFR